MDVQACVYVGVSRRRGVTGSVNCHTHATSILLPTSILEALAGMRVTGKEEKRVYKSGM